MKAIDVANYTQVPTAEQLDCLRADDVGRAIVGGSFGDVAPRQALAFCGAGMELEGYAWLTSQAWYVPTAARAVSQLDGRPVQRWWLDCEENMGLLTSHAVRERIRDVLALFVVAAPSARRGIYTRREWWVRETDDWRIVEEFPALDLFESHYVHADGEPCAGVDVERALIPAFAPFGGWTSRAMVQWHGSVRVCPPNANGLNVDLDEIEEDPLDAPTKGEFGALYGLAVKTRDAVVEIGRAVGDLAQHVYGQDEPKVAALQQRVDELAAEEGKPTS